MAQNTAIKIPNITCRKCRKLYPV